MEVKILEKGIERIRDNYKEVKVSYKTMDAIVSKMDYDMSRKLAFVRIPDLSQNEVDFILRTTKKLDITNLPHVSSVEIVDNKFIIHFDF